MKPRYWLALALTMLFAGFHVLILGGRGWLIALAGAALAASLSLLVLALLLTVDAIEPEVARVTSRGRR